MNDIMQRRRPTLKYPWGEPLEEGGTDGFMNLGRAEEKRTYTMQSRFRWHFKYTLNMKITGHEGLTRVLEYVCVCVRWFGWEGNLYHPTPRGLFPLTCMHAHTHSHLQGQLLWQLLVSGPQMLYFRSRQVKLFFLFLWHTNLHPAKKVHN